MTEDHPFVIRERRKAAVQELVGILLAAVVCFIVGCPTKPPEPPVPDAGDAGAGSCAAVCTRLRELHCPGGEPTHEGATCESVCQNIQDSGIVRWNLPCRAAAKSCPAVDACDVDAQQ